MGIVPRDSIKAMAPHDRSRAIMAIERHVHERITLAIRREYEHLAEELRCVGYRVIQSDHCLIDYYEQPDSDGERVYVQALSNVFPKVYFGERKEGDPDFQTEYNRIVESVQTEMDRARRKSIDVGYDQLTEAEQQLFLIADLIAEVDNGGFSQYLTNPSGQHMDEAMKACSRIGARRTVSLLEKVRSTLLAAGLSPDHSNIDEIVSTPKVSRSLAKLDQRFLSLNENVHYLCWKTRDSRGGA